VTVSTTGSGECAGSSGVLSLIARVRVKFIFESEDDVNICAGT